MPILLSYDEYDIVFKPNNNIKKIYIELTNDCNLSCDMCYRNSWQVTTGEMQEQTFLVLVDEIASSIAVEEIILGGLGEPMVHKNFWDFLQLLHRKAPLVPISLTTNGLLLNPTIVNKLSQHGVTKVIVSLDGADIETQSRLRGKMAGNLHKKLIELGKAFYENANIVWWWETVWQKKNQNQLESVVRLANTCDVKKLIISHLLPTSKKQMEEVLYNPVLEESNVRNLDAVRNLALLHGIDIALPKSKLKTERNCRFVNNQSVVISYEGKVAPCYRFLHGCKEFCLNRIKEVKPHNFGMINHNQTLLDIWNCPPYVKFRYGVKNNLYPSCHDCDFLEGCDTATRSEGDCDGGEPNCGDCLWSRGFIHCP